MNVLSLFDGMSCGQIALNRAGIKYENYYASEIDKHAMKVTMANFPNTIQLGDVTKVSGYDLPKIDLLIGGSPCQGFSFAGKMLNFEDPRSKLFFEYVRILHECKEKNPDIKFLLENVKMKKESELVITQALNCYPIEIDSALLSAQRRKRLYWTNIGATHTDLFGCIIPGIEQPKDKGIFLKDIIEAEVSEKYYLTQKQIEQMNAHKQRNEQNGNGFGWKPISTDDKANALLNAVAGSRRNAADNYFCVASRGRGQYNDQTLEGRKDGKTNSLASVVKDNYLFADCRTDEGLRIRTNGKAGTINARAREDICGVGMVIKNNLIRRLTPTECEALQTVPKNYTNHVMDSQRYKMLGNGWTVDVIVHILSYL